MAYSKFYLWEMIESNLLCCVMVVYTINRWVAFAIFVLQFLKLVWSVFCQVHFLLWSGYSLAVDDFLFF